MVRIDYSMSRDLTASERGTGHILSWCWDAADWKIPDGQPSVEKIYLVYGIIGVRGKRLSNGKPLSASEIKRGGFWCERCLQKRGVIW